MSDARDEAEAAVGGLLAGRGRGCHRSGDLLVLDSGVAQRLDDLAVAYADARRAGASPEQAADRLVAALDASERRVVADAGEGRVRLRVTHPRELDPAHTLPGPADLIVYPVLDEPTAATRLGPAQTRSRGGLEAVGVAAWEPTLAEPVQVRWSTDDPDLPGWRVTGDIYTASRLLDVARLLGELGADAARGHLVIVPSSREVWVFPDPGTSGALDRARALARHRHAVSLGRVSPAAYRWDGVGLSVAGGAAQPGSSDIGP